MQRGQKKLPTKNMLSELKNKHEMICCICKRKYLGHKSSKYCSKDCYGIYYRKQYSKQNCSYKECEMCRKIFYQKKSIQKYCSTQCSINKFKSTEKYKSYQPKLVKLRFDVLKRDNFTCQYCGRNVKEDNIKLHVDHIFPKSKGGKDIIENYTTACTECNLGKSNTIL